MAILKIANREKIQNQLAGTYRFDPTDFETLNGNYTWKNWNIEKVRAKLDDLKEPLHEKLKNGLGIDFKSNIGGGYPYGDHPIDSIWLSFTERKGSAYVPYPQLNVGIKAEGLEVFFLLVDKARTKTGQRIWQKYCSNLINGLEIDGNKKSLRMLIKEQNFRIGGNNIEMAIKNIDSQGLWIHKEIDKSYVINLEDEVSDEIFRTFKSLYPIYRIAMSSQI